MCMCMCMCMYYISERRRPTQGRVSGEKTSPFAITRSEGGALCNHFPMGKRGNDERLRMSACEAYAVWLRLRTVPASAATRGWP